MSQSQERQDTEKPAFRWYIGADGVHRYRRNLGTHWEQRAHVYFERGYVWTAYCSDPGTEITDGVKPTLELAKTAAERAVARMDGEELS